MGTPGNLHARASGWIDIMWLADGKVEVNCEMVAQMKKNAQPEMNALNFEKPRQSIKACLQTTAKRLGGTSQEKNDTMWYVYLGSHELFHNESLNSDKFFRVVPKLAGSLSVKDN